MNKFKQSAIVLFCLANLTLACTSGQKKQEKIPKQNTPISKPLETVIKTDSLSTPQQTVDELISLFQQTPSFAALDSVEYAIQLKLPGLPLEQRYQLLEQWQTALSPHINDLDFRQTKLLILFDQFEIASIDGENAFKRRKRVEAKFQTKLNPEQKQVFQQLIDHHIEIINEEEKGAVFHLSPSYWKSLFASHLLKDDRKFWDQTAVENDPVIDYDAGLAIDRVTLGDWAFYWEQFLKDYPKSYYKKMAQLNYQDYLNHLLVGLENTPTTEDDSNKLLPDVATDFEKIIRRHPGSNVALSIGAFRKTLQESKDKLNLSNLSKISIRSSSR
ncbi:hypothetical protein [Pedobacter caeni]|uniref:Lipoprotein n=1 Tax=Pedobacter caeni TaxID=288992 RepID=A0A1M5BKX8_9SPHI|nr:hypothetical protein [Pedobacter caeni]SHF43055.1 hypothetical protein SAMN04488522_1021239 [Pedobacter caeni]